MSPGYATRGILSTKPDMFSFGVLTLEIVSNGNNASFPTLHFKISLVM
ncbi:putative serine/threonine-protein kinase receptor [Nymphaea thermarum]|nr:putative serine/threonine-protein kinase receptor [Nymphaea thermarum]